MDKIPTTKSKNGRFFTGKIVECCTCGKKIYKQPAFYKRAKNKWFACSISCRNKKVSLDKTGSTPWNKGKIGIQTAWNKGKEMLNISGNKHPQWKNGKTNTGNGYISKWVKPAVRKLEHRVIMEIILNRELKKGEVVHHINGDRKDNRPENLMLFANNSDHIKYHNKIKCA